MFFWPLISHLPDYINVLQCFHWWPLALLTSIYWSTSFVLLGSRTNEQRLLTLFCYSVCLEYIPNNMNEWIKWVFAGCWETVACRHTNHRRSALLMCKCHKWPFLTLLPLLLYPAVSVAWCLWKFKNYNLLGVSLWVSEKYMETLLIGTDAIFSSFFIEF